MEHFELFHVHLETRIVISLKELRSILHFGNICGFTLTLHFDRPGRPLIIAIDENMDLIAEFVLATMDDFDSHQAHVFQLIKFYSLFSVESNTIYFKSPTRDASFTKKCF